ncbi:MAG: KEOPS complex kinase/ATPase Bud32 [Candidatus Micrarchaeota archaeon]
MRGAEAVLSKKILLGRQCVVKERLPKGYRATELDRRLRMERTRGEARLLHKAKLAGVDCPTVYEVDDFRITMGFIGGSRPAMDEGDAEGAGRMLAKLHKDDIIHGDFTPANLILSDKRLYVIDFGLGFISKDIEDKAVDVFTMLRALGDGRGKGKSRERAEEAFLSGYDSYEKAPSVLKRVKDVEKRVRYAA